MSTPDNHPAALATAAARSAAPALTTSGVPAASPIPSTPENQPTPAASPAPRTSGVHAATTEVSA